MSAKMRVCSGANNGSRVSATSRV
ncbi:hypothetical protein MTR67_047937 [Solanum verrucosum]|uniref:Uncharacterized protein n=1 Tax=Solanum verrucosum TaxID=315347 RepID=A0AAF0UXZ9_SOLVR|nr:hypothetical protein MTR67_047937 [Solanum verrucosum]